MSHTTIQYTFATVLVFVCLLPWLSFAQRYDDVQREIGIQELKRSKVLKFSNGTVRTTHACINNITRSDISRGEKTITILYAHNFSQGDIDLLTPRNSVSGEVYAKKYFCIASVVPLVVYPGYIIKSIRE